MPNAIAIAFEPAVTMLALVLTAGLMLRRGGGVAEPAQARRAA